MRGEARLAVGGSYICTYQVCIILGAVCNQHEEMMEHSGWLRLQFP